MEVGRWQDGKRSCDGEERSPMVEGPRPAALPVVKIWMQREPIVRHDNIKMSMSHILVDRN